MNKRKALYPGSFDPLTYGHMDLIDRALQIFDEVHVAIASNIDKSPLFGVEERFAMVRKATTAKKRVVVSVFDGLIVKYAKKYGIKTVHMSDSFSAYRKSALNEIGWCKEGLIVSEETYIGAKMLLNDYKIAYVDDAIVYHSHDYSIVEEFKRYFDVGIFHRQENWIIEKFGAPMNEGKRYVKSEINFLIKNKKIYRIPELFIRSIAKYLGYKLGYHYKKLPLKIGKRFSRQKSWWKNNKESK